VYSGGKSGESDNKDSGRVSCGDMYDGSTELVLVLPSDLYLLLESVSVNASRPSSCLILHHLPTTFKLPLLSLRKDVNDFGLRRLFYFKQDLKNSCCSLV